MRGSSAAATPGPSSSTSRKALAAPRRPQRMVTRAAFAACTSRRCPPGWTAARAAATRGPSPAPAAASRPRSMRARGGGVQVRFQHVLAQRLEVHPLHAAARACRARRPATAPAAGWPAARCGGWRCAACAPARCGSASVPCRGCAAGRLRPGLHLRLQAGQRRAQLVGGVGDEAALALGLRIDQPEQAVERVAPAAAPPRAKPLRRWRSGRAASAAPPPPSAPAAA